MHEQLKNAPFELKELKDSGEFVGFASLYGNVDLGGDVVEPGAFKKTIEQRGNKVRLMDGHKVRIGVATVEETPTGLKAYGKINIAKQSGQEAYSDLKFYQANGMPMGMSFGYETLDVEPAHKSKDGARHLKEVRLWEVTVTEFPMNEQAQVTSVKTIADLIAAVKESRKEKKDDFLSELQEIQLYAARYQMNYALCSALDDAIEEASQPADAVAASEVSIQQFKDAYLGMLPDYFALMASEQMGWMSRPGFETKVGRVLSQTNRDLITKCVTDLQALLDATADEGTGKSGTPPGAATKSDEGDRLSADQIEEIRSLIPAV